MDETEDLELSDLDAAAPLPGKDSDASTAVATSGSLGDDNPAAGLDAVYDIPVQVSAVLGKSSMQVSQLLKLGRGAVVELDRKVGEAIDIYVNNRLIARGEVVVVDERLGVTMTEIIKSDRANQG
jgi:flagellar motor switch protein FliN/FliY